MHWLLSSEALQLRVIRSVREARTPLTAQLPRPAANREAPASLTIDGRTATIRVEGVLTPTPDLMAEVYGEPNTTYADLQDSLQAALADSAVKEIVWSIDSPGGAVDGLFALLDDIEDARAAGRKPMRALASNAHSAAYGIAAAVGNITAANRMSSFGSVGVATSGFIQGGICGTVVDLTSSDAPEKRPNLATEEGKAVVVKYLDQLAAEFMGTIARGRGVEPGAVAAGYGRGSSMLAGAALEAGLIDAIQPRASTNGRSRLTDANGRASVSGSMADESPVEAVEQNVDAAAPEVLDVPVTVDLDALALSAAERSELAELRAERDARQAAERRSLVTALVELGAETPATAWEKDAPSPRLASEPLDSLRSRVTALRAVPRPSASHAAPPAGSTGEEALEDFERADAAKIKDPDARARFVASRLARKQKAQNHV